MKQKGKRWTAIVMAAALLLSLSTGHTGMEKIDHAAVTEVKAASGNVSLSRILKTCGIPSIGRASSEGLWSIRVGGKKTFCLNSGKTMNSNDHASGKTHDAATYSNQSLAKVLTYYFGEKEQKGGTRLFLLCQAYVWACGKGTSKRTAMVEAGKNIGVSATEAAKVYKEIQQTDPYGKITYYTITRCAGGKSGASHQHLLGWSGTKIRAEYGTYSQPYTAEASEDITVTVTKKDAHTGKGLAGGVYELYRDGVKMAAVTTDENGRAIYSHTENYQATVAASGAYVWVKNWNSLSAAQQAVEKQKGYYSSEAYAIAACLSEQKPRAEALLETQKKAVHIWKAVEIQAPENHRISQTAMQKRTEKEDITEIAFAFTDQCARMTLKLCKKSNQDCGPEASLKGAVYELYAAETIRDTDNRTVKYAKGDLAALLTTAEDGTAQVQNLLPGRYWLSELTAPRGFEKDSDRHPVDLTYTEGASLVREVTVTEQPVMNTVRVHKTFDKAAAPVETVAKKQLREEYMPGPCAHHTEHDEDCGYVQETEGQPCGHEHTQECWRQELVCTLEDAEHTHTEGCYENVLDCGHVHDEICGYAEAFEGHPCDFFCEECAYEEVFVEERIPVTDAFALIDAGGNTAASFSIGEDGYGESAPVPYGTYTLHQTSSTRGYAPVPDCLVKVQDSAEDIVMELDDLREAPRIYLTKYKIIADEETDTFVKEAETDAEFALYGPDGQLVTRVKTDARGVAYFGELKEMGVYRVCQISGAADYRKMEEQTVRVTEKKSYFITGEDAYCGDKIRIRKFTEKSGKTPEPEAEFVLLDGAYIGETMEELAAMDSEEERLDYVFSLETDTPEAILGRMCTDSEGKAVRLLTEWQEENHPKGCIVFQIHGEEGYALAEPVCSRDMEVREENGMRVYEMEAVDVWDDWADISLTKHMTTDEHRTVPEESAVFRVVDENEQTVEQKSTDQDGRAVFRSLPLGTYRVEQISGTQTHELMDPVYVTLSKKHKHQEICLSEEPLVNREKEIRFTLTKRSGETGIPLGGARYELYRITADEEDSEGEKKTRITELLTHDSQEEMVQGTASFCLPYGTYELKEISPPDGYLADEREYRFVLDKDSVTYDEEGNGSFELELQDEPIRGTIALHKTGGILIGYDGASESFLTREGNIPGAVYGLYAREDICRDDGTVVSQAGTLIDKKTTDASGNIVFTRQDADGEETDRFYLGKYYVKELSAPEGYVLDPTEYEVCLTWDNKAEQFDDIKKVENTADTEPPVGNNSPDPDAGRYVLETGEELNAVFKEGNAASVTFTWEKAPADAALTHVSSDKSDGIVLWHEGSDYYVSTQLAGQVMYLNAVSSRMFADCTSLTEIRFDNTDTSRMVDASYMFYRCQGLTQLDLSSFNMKKTENVSRMFAYCSALETVYVNDQVLNKEELYEEDVPSRIAAEPKNTVIVGHSYTVDDFTFTMFYENGKSEEIYPTQTEAEISPNTAEEEGEQTVRILFTSVGRYGEFGTILCQVKVLDPKQIPVTPSFHEPQVRLQMNDEVQGVTIQFIKADAADDETVMLEGAEFTLYAACEIVDGNGNTLFTKDQPIAAQISGGQNFSYVEFAHLPSAVYQRDRSSPYMYYIRETKAPEGYEGNDKVLYISGETTDSTKTEFIYGYTGASTEAADTVFAGSDDFLYQNKKTSRITLKKEWLGDSKAEKPDILPVTVTLLDGTEKNYILKAAEGWRLVTDLEAGLFDGYGADNVRERFREAEMEAYTENGSTWDGKTQTFTFRNVSEHTVSSTVEKRWEDRDDYDGIRPDSIEVTLYADESPVKTLSLPTKDGKWTYTETDLPAENEQGMLVAYSWKETPTALISGDADSGYLSLAEADPSDVQKTIITNFHAVKTVDKSVRKVWNDAYDAQQIRPQEVWVRLLGDEKPVNVIKTQEGYVWAGENETDAPDRICLSKENNWQAKVCDLPEYAGGQKITYTWEEVEDANNWITGESTFGYAASCKTDSTDPDKTVLTNTHSYFTGATVTVNKKIAKENLSFAVDDPVFTITLQGEDIYGRQQYRTETVTFTPEDLAAAAGEDEVVKTVTFTQLPYGSYEVKESGMEGIYEQKNLESLTPGTEIRDDGFVVTIEPEKTGKMQQKQTGVYRSCDQEMTFENQAVRGSVTVIKYGDGGKAVLEGVSFCLKSTDGTVNLTAVTDAQGKAVFTDLMPGTYTVTETKTKAGYTLLAEPITVQIPLRVTPQEAENKALAVSRAVAYQNAYYFYDLQYEVTDHASLKLPLTGFSEDWRARMEMAAAMALACAGAIAFFRKRKTVFTVKEASDETV